MKKVNQVMQTNDYSIFKKLEGNRDLNRAHYNRLRGSISENSLMCPILVNEKKEIVDGQNRFKAWQELGLPVLFIEVKGYGLKEVQILNTNIKNWSIGDFANCYSDLGFKDYVLYKDFRAKYGFSHQVCVILLQDDIDVNGGNLANYNGGGHSTFHDFKKGKFKIVNYNKACANADKIFDLKDYYDGWNRRSFVFAVLTLLNNSHFEYKRLVQKLKYQSNKMVDCTNKNAYLVLLQDIYNYNASNKINLIYS
jgi:hypothetical protein